MVSLESLKDLLTHNKLTNQDKILICLAAQPLSAKAVKDIKQIAIDSGLRSAAKWNISSYLSRAKTLAILTSKGWELTSHGKSHIEKLTGVTSNSVSKAVTSDLRNHLIEIPNLTTRIFVEEAVKCLEFKLYRSAIITSWVGAISTLYDEIVKSHLSTFNNEATKRHSKWQSAKTADDLARMKEYDFLQILVAISVIGKNVKDELESCLKLRNGCGHPNSLVVGELKTSAHIETLIQNIFSKF